ncbi:MAG TPA: DUF6650 family protein [Bryobacteraceae bacterium]|nr:DUF6650 family protein [Bryobacteraceae bacterium]
MNWKEAVNRINGISIVSFGVQWAPRTMDTEVARRVLRFLEDRRVLYNDYAWEEPEHCVRSVLEIRRFLTDEIAKQDDGADLLGPLRAMRAACRKFLDKTQHEGSRRLYSSSGAVEAFGFFAALGEFRGAVGSQVAFLSGCYEIDIEDELARILPVPDSE